MYKGGPVFYDISFPEQPRLRGGFSDTSYIHDAQIITYKGEDQNYFEKEILFGSNSDGGETNQLIILDVTEKTNPELISTISYSYGGYTHQGWIDENHRYFYLGDELDELKYGNKTRIITFDLKDLKNPKIAIPIVLFAGILWSFGPYVVRHIDQPETVPWQYLFARGIVIFLLLNVYLFLEEGFSFYKNYLKIGISGIIGGVGLGTAMITFIWSITNTTAAVTLLCLAAMPFITALLGFLFLKEKISITVWISILVAAFGIIVMAYDNTGENSLMGLIFGLVSALGFSIFSVSLRWRKQTPTFTTVAIAGLFCFLFSTVMLLNNDANFLSSNKNEALFATHGTLVCMGLILYSIGSKHIPAADLTLLSLTEVIGGIFWVWLPWLGINEIPSTNTIIGGFFIFLAIFYYSMIMQSNRRFIGLN